MTAAQAKKLVPGDRVLLAEGVTRAYPQCAFPRKAVEVLSVYPFTALDSGYMVVVLFGDRPRQIGLDAKWVKRKVKS